MGRSKPLSSQLMPITEQTLYLIHPTFDINVFGRLALTTGFIKKWIAYQVVKYFQNNGLIGCVKMSLSIKTQQINRIIRE